MPSTTPYKDELIRVLAVLGLPDDTDLEGVADAVQDALAAKDAPPAETTRGAAALRHVAQELETRRQRAGSSQAFADMTEIALYAASEALALA